MCVSSFIQSIHQVIHLNSYYKHHAWINIYLPFVSLQIYKIVFIEKKEKNFKILPFILKHNAISFLYEYILGFVRCHQRPKINWNWKTLSLFIHCLQLHKFPVYLEKRIFMNKRMNECRQKYKFIFSLFKFRFFLRFS